MADNLSRYAQNEVRNASWNRMLEARDRLQLAQFALSNCRKYAPDLVERATRDFCAALDRAWEAQCMAQATY